MTLNSSEDVKFIEETAIDGVRRTGITGFQVKVVKIVPRDGTPGVSLLLQCVLGGAELIVPVLADARSSMAASHAKGSRPARRELERDMSRVVTSVLRSLREAKVSFGGVREKVADLNLGLWLPHVELNPVFPGSLVIDPTTSLRALVTYALTDSGASPEDTRVVIEFIRSYNDMLRGRVEITPEMQEAAEGWSRTFNEALDRLPSARSEKIRAMFVKALERMDTEFDRIERESSALPVH